MTDSLGPTLHDITRTLESCVGSDAREIRVLELLRRIVPFELCALLHMPPGGEPRLVIVPGAPLGAVQSISDTMVNLHSQLVDDRAHSITTPSNRSGADLAVPLIGDDKAIGVLLVRGAACDGLSGGYTEQHLRDLAIVGAHLAGYLLMVAQAGALEQRRREAEAANRMKDTFLALVSRALKSTLTSTLAWVSILRAEDTTLFEHHRAVEAIERNANAQARKVDELLELSCAMAADPHLDLEIVNPIRLIEAAVEGQRGQSERRSVRVEAVLDESVGPLLVDPPRIERVISNLLANAIQFSAPGSRVGVHLAQVGARARIQVIDQGRGIPAEDLPHLFDTFRTGGNPLARTYGDLGGGLVIAKPLVEAHGGCIRAESRGKNQGSTLTVELPLRAAPLDASEKPLAGVRVLLVDDDGDICLGVKMVLEHYGAAVTVASSVAGALEALERSRPHVVLSDLIMVGESGYDLIRKLTAWDPTLPAAALTASVRSGEYGRALSAGFQSYLAKPFAISSLVKTVASLAGRQLAGDLGAPVTA
jgi:signal transduction histidine kinase/CheY-like chemotaxis protein